MQVQPHLNFDGRCEEALEFYRDALGAEVIALLRYKDQPECQNAPPGADDKIMHAMVRIGGSTLLASDCHSRGQANFQGFSLALDPPNEDAADRAFRALADGGRVQMPLLKTFFSPCFGVVVDRFGLCWMICVPQQGACPAEAPSQQRGEASSRDKRPTAEVVGGRR